MTAAQLEILRQALGALHDQGHLSDTSKWHLTEAVINVFACFHDPVHGGEVSRRYRDDEVWGEPAHIARINKAVRLVHDLIDGHDLSAAYPWMRR